MHRIAAPDCKMRLAEGLEEEGWKKLGEAELGCQNVLFAAHTAHWQEVSSVEETLRMSPGGQEGLATDQTSGAPRMLCIKQATLFRPCTLDSQYVPGAR